MTVRTVREEFEFEGEPYTLVFDFEVIAHFEETNGISLGDVLNPPGGGSPMVSRLAKLFLSGLLPNHPDADLNLAGAMMASAGVQAKFYGAVSRSMPQAGDAGEEGNGTAPNRKARRAAQSRSAGKTG
jgi:hypothetical protein